MLPIEDKRQRFYEEKEKGNIEGIGIDYYNYCNEADDPKKEFYKEYKPNAEEIKKTNDFKKRFAAFVIATRGEQALKTLPLFLEGKIHYKENFGYITVINPDRDMVDIIFYGEDEDTAFMHAITGYMWRCGDYYEYNNRKELAEDFRRRFPDDVREDNYYFTFYVCEYALRTLNNYFNGNIPENIKNYFERELNPKWQFDYEHNCMIKKEKNLEPQLIKPEDK